jgi:hypothetical protein
MSAARSPNASKTDSSPRQATRGSSSQHYTSRSVDSPEAVALDQDSSGNVEGENVPLWVSLPAVQELYLAAIGGSGAAQCVSMISWLKFWSERGRSIPAACSVSKTDLITIFLDTKRGAVGADAHELSLADFCSCLIAVADRLSMVSIPSSPGRTAASLAPSTELLSAMSSLTKSLLQSHESLQVPAVSAQPAAAAAAAAAAPSMAPVSTEDDSHIGGKNAVSPGTPAASSVAPDISSQVLQLLHRFYEFYSRGAPRLHHDSYVQCLIELHVLHQAINAASGDATQIFFKFAATPDRGMTQEQFVDSFVHLAHASAPHTPLHSSLHALVVLGMNSHFMRLQERYQLKEVMDSSAFNDVLRDTLPFCNDAFTACSGGKSISNIAQVNRWIVAHKLQPMPSQTDIIRVFRDVLRIQAARGSSSVGLDSVGFQSFLLQISMLPLHTAQLTPSSAIDCFKSMLTHIGWGSNLASSPPHSSLGTPSAASTSAPLEHRHRVASPASAPVPPSAAHSATYSHPTFSPNVASPPAPYSSPPVPAGISISLTKASSGSVAASVGADVLTQLTDLDQAEAFAELQRIYTDKQVLVVQRKKEMQAELEAWAAAEYEAAEMKYKEQAIFRPTPALQDRERALQVLVSNATKTHPDQLRRQQQIVEAFASKERQAWRFRCDVYASTVRSRVKIAVDAKKSRLADTLKSMQIQLEVNMKKDFEALSRRFAGKSIFLRSSGAAPPVNDRPQPQAFQTQLSAAATSGAAALSAKAIKPSAAARSLSAPRRHASFSVSTQEADVQHQDKQSSGTTRERPQSSIPTMSRRKSVLQEMEEAYLKAASRFGAVLQLCASGAAPTFLTNESGPSLGKPRFHLRREADRRSPPRLDTLGSDQHRRCPTRRTAGAGASLQRGVAALATHPTASRV